jgi:hypothetical protein
LGETQEGVTSSISARHLFVRPCKSPEGKARQHSLHSHESGILTSLMTPLHSYALNVFVFELTLFFFQSRTDLMGRSKAGNFKWDLNGTYTVEEFEEINDSLRTEELVIDGVPINHFELSPIGKLLPMPQVPVGRECVTMEIVRQLANWNINCRQNGVVTSSQGGFNFASDGREIRAPDVAFTPKETYRSLTEEQR